MNGEAAGTAGAGFRGQQKAADGDHADPTTGPEAVGDLIGLGRFYRGHGMGSLTVKKMGGRR